MFSALRLIRVRLTLWYILLLAIILAMFSLAIYFTLRHSLYANLDDSLEARSEELLPAVTFSSGEPAIEGVGPVDEGEQYVRIFDTSGNISVNTTTGPQPIDSDAVQSALAGGSKTFTRHSDTGTFRVHIVPVQRGANIIAALASLGGIFLAGRALRPIDDITRVARRLSADDLSQRLNLDLPDDEVGRLARTFDDMLARLDRAFQQQRQFTSDASHEMRTPLTAIKGEVEIALSKERSAADYREVLRSVNEEVDRLIRLVGSLLTLARADAGQLALEREPIDVADLVAGTVDHVRPRAAERGIEIKVTPGPPAMLHADEGLLVQLLLNLLDNAIKYASQGGRVDVTWANANGGVDLSVKDSGPGIPPEHLPHVFDRFYRIDAARSRSDGVGLGLSISQWIARAHGGSISVTSADAQGSTFTASFPR